MNKEAYFFSLFIFFISINVAGQNLIKANHETDDQRSVDITFNVAPGTAPTTASFNVTANGIPMTIIAVTPVPAPTYRITFSAPLPIDPDPVVVTYKPTGSIINSVNNRSLVCSDFEWETNTRPTPPCAPVDPINKMVFSIKRGARNSSQYDISKISSRISWNDPLNTITAVPAYESDGSGNRVSSTTFIAFDADLDDFNYPENDKSCSYTSEWKLFIDGLGSCAPTNPNQFITYTSHNVDDKGNGQILFNPKVARSNQVCLNDEANVQFVDRSILNCINAPAQPNNEGRWVRIIYGDPSRAAGERIPNVHINGIPVTDDKGALVNPNGAGNLTLTSEGIVYTGNNTDIFGVKYYPPPVTGPVAQFLPITTNSTPAGLTNRKPGDKFIVRMQYWNICNPYDDVGNIAKNERSQINNVIIIDIPNPPVAEPREICHNGAVGNFSVTVEEINSKIRWYNKNPKEGGTLITNPLGESSTELPAQGIVNNASPGVYSVWATTISGANSCESEPVQTFITVRNPLTGPGEITGINVVCNGTNDITYSLPDPEGTSEYGGAWEYFWSHSEGGGVTFDNNTGRSVSVDFNINSITDPSVTRKIHVVKRYKNAPPTCPGESRTFQVTIFKPSVGGAVSPDKAICEEASTGTLTLSGHIGDIIKWQRQVNSGNYIDIANTQGLTSYSETINTAGEYRYRAVVTNGVCSPAFSTPAVITVGAVPQKPVIREASGRSFTTCEGSNEIILTSSNVGGTGQNFEWYRTSDLENPVHTGPDNQLVLNEPAHSGEYVVKVIGASPTNCESVFSDPVNVTINPLPSATASGGGSVCSGNPAPDIVWKFTGVAPFDFRISVTGQPDIVVNNYTSDTYTITAPEPETTTEYRMTSLVDASNCTTGSLGGTITVSIGGTPPVFENATPKVNPAVCNDGAATVVPAITLDLDQQDTYRLIYNINGNARQSFTFTTDANGVYVLQPDFTKDPFNTTPGNYTYNLVSIENTTTGCLTPINQPLNVIINPRPAAPSNATNAVACSVAENGAALKVDDPGNNFSIRWFTAYSNPSSYTPVTENEGLISGPNNNTFTPSSTESAKYFAAVQDNRTGCLSLKAVALRHTQDVAPTANADIDDDESNNVTCSAEFSLQANVPRVQGTWSGPDGVIFSDINDPNATVSNLPVGTSTLQWTVRSAYGVCAEATDEITIEKFPVPAAIDPEPFLCADESGSTLQVTGINLSADYKDLITGVKGSTNLEVSWFLDPERARPVPNPTNYTADNRNRKVVYTRVTNTKNNCSNDGTLTFTVQPLPEAIDITDELCEDELNKNEVSNVDLTSYNIQITRSAPNRTVNWFSDPNYTVAVPDPKNVAVNNDEVFYARVTDTSNASLCTNDATLSFKVNRLPENNPISGPTTQCAGSTIQLYQINPALNPGSTFSWNIPDEFTLFGGGGSEDFFVLLNFPTKTTADLEVTEISADGCRGNVQKLTISVVDSPPPLKILPENPEICENESGVVFTVENLPNTSYAWTVPAGASIINGQGTNQIVVNFGLFGGNVSVVPTSTSGNCAGSSSQTTVTINQRPQMAPDLGRTVCSEEASGITLSYLASGQPATTYDITHISVDPGLISDESNAVTGTSQPANALFNDTYTNQTGQQLTAKYTIRPRSNKGCLGPAAIITLKVNPAPRLSASLNNEKCSGETSDIILAVSSGSIPAESYTILSVDDKGLDPNPDNKTFSGNFPYTNVSANFLQQERYRNYTENPVDVVYEVMPVSQTCTGNPSFVTFTVLPEPVGSDITEAAVCSGELFSLALQDYINQNNKVRSNFTWTATYGPDIKGSMRAGSGDISETLTNIGTAQHNVVYTVTPKSASQGSCTGESFKITVPVYPQVQAKDQNIVVCSNESIVDLNGLKGSITENNNNNEILWYSNAAATDRITNPGRYDVNDQNIIYAAVTRGNCSRVAKVTFNITEIDVTAIGVTSDYNGYDLSCNGAMDAAIKFEANGGRAPYSYTLNENPDNTTGASSGEFSGLPSGTYTVTVTDANGCISDTSEPVVVRDPLPLKPGSIFGVPDVCLGSLPSTFTQVRAPLGGTGNYSYQWEVSLDASSFEPANGNTANNAEYDAVAEDFSAGVGEYYFRRLVSSSDAPECSNVPSNIIKVTVHDLPTGDFTFKDMDGNTIDEICAGDPFLIEFNFSTGKSHYTFDYHDDKGNIYTNVYGPSTTSILVNYNDVQSTTTYTLDRVRDMYGCELSTPVNISHTINVIDVDAEFSVVEPRESCSPSKIQFEYDQVKGVTYTWRWFDGTPDSSYTATTTVANKRISHVFDNKSPTASINYEVFLYASDTSASGTFCERYTSEKVTVNPRVQANVFAQNAVVCSNEPIRFTNLTQGAQSHRWYYRIAGDIGQENQVQTSENATFTISNTGPENPQVYEVVYTGSAGQGSGNVCSDTQVVQVEVYKQIIPDFTFTVEPPSFGSTSVKFNNTSVPNNDVSNFSYNWKFGDDMRKEDAPDPGTVIYTKPGQKVVTLEIINKEAPGLCNVTINKTVKIQNVPITADFRVEQQGVCRGDEITITNRSTGEANEFTWEIFDESNVLVYKHIDEVKIENTKLNSSFSFVPKRAGVYRVHLTARNTWSNDVEEVVKNEAFEVYELPMANFDTRPDVVFVPDQPLTTYNLSNDADSYRWDFGDGSTVSTEFEPEHRYKEEGFYNVTLVASAQYPGGVTCSDSVTRKIEAQSGSYYKVPNAFSPSPAGPSGDGRIRREEDNDIFLPVTKGVEEFHMVIYDRWGEMVFQSTDKEVGWDGYDKNGRLMPAGVYIYRLNLQFSNGQRRTISGDVMLIR